MKHEVGTVLHDRYEITKLLGEGGLGNAYLAVDTTSNETVVIKQLAYQSPRVDGWENLSRSRFENEHKLLTKLKTNYTPKVLAFHDDTHNPLIVLEHISARSLSDYIKQENEDDELSLRLILNIAKGIASLHHEGVMHCDLKPDNILVGDADYITIIDFDISDTINGDYFFGDMSPGTSPYKSPEQVLSGKIDQRTDIYSFGLIAYEILTGERLMDDENFMRAEMRQLVVQELSPRKKNSTIPKWCDTLTQLCLQKAPRDRFQSMDEVVEMIEDQLAPGKKSSLLKRLLSW